MVLFSSKRARLFFLLDYGWAFRALRKTQIILKWWFSRSEVKMRGRNAIHSLLYLLGAYLLALSSPSVELEFSLFPRPPYMYAALCLMVLGCYSGYSGVRQKSNWEIVAFVALILNALGAIGFGYFLVCRFFFAPLSALLYLFIVIIFFNAGHFLYFKRGDNRRRE